jgi:hypothetical protein
MMVMVMVVVMVVIVTVAIAIQVLAVLALAGTDGVAARCGGSDVVRSECQLVDGAGHIVHRRRGVPHAP